MSEESVQYVIDVWKEINLDGKRSELDTQASEITQSKEINANFRKKLAEQTKEFRKTDDSEKLRNFGPLLKAYQEEIDRLTRRSKFAENSYLSIYKLLAEAPDPLKALTNVQEQSSKSSKFYELDFENKKLKTELEEFKREFSGVKNQEVTIRSLEDQLNEYKSKMENIINERVKGNEKQVYEEKQKLIDQLTQRENEAKRNLALARDEINKVQQVLSVTQNEYSELRSTFDEKVLARQTEMDMLTEELEASRLKIAQLEREKERVSEKNQNQGIDSIHPDLELQIAQKDVEISHLKEQLKQLESSNLLEKSGNYNKVSELESQIEAKNAKVKQLNEELKSRPTNQEFNKIKEQYLILKRATDYEENENEDLTLEKILKDKNKRLETQFMQSRASLKTKEEENKKLEEKLETSYQTEKELRGLIFKLEEDISKGSHSTGGTGGGNGEGRDKSTRIVEEIMASPKANKDEENNTVLQVVTNQRDRFRGRIRDLEDENKTIRSKMQQKDQEVTSLREDNIKLYERIRFLQSYPASNNSRNRGGNPTTITVDSEGDQSLDKKYSALYEDSVNPFVLFNRKEKYQRYKDLNPAEKVILNGGQLLLSTKYSRTFLFFYSVGLHLLVVLSLYKSAMSSVTPRDQMQ